ncbi:hypothetical protein PHYPO_G00002790 [Pangasianodon hypophthalmus]|uniref:Uncharacterized protein n=1 Tax=Pangasianodon hypophthalmus TaxID=310915 RepID=A0A5N5Q5L4_PANHP|nr:hypothetical protein PHYPO_G00002790 [Pangasianodon hypophthalmus]
MIVLWSCLNNFAICSVLVIASNEDQRSLWRAGVLRPIDFILSRIKPSSSLQRKLLNSSEGHSYSIYIYMKKKTSTPCFSQDSTFPYMLILLFKEALLT